MANQTKPNILLIMSDQHHRSIMGCSDQLAHTPAMDRLAAEGVRMSRAYCNFPLSGPSRMSFMSCCLPSRIGCLDNFAQLGADWPTFAHGFLAAGYETILSGRMHFVGEDQRHGFEKRIIGDCSAGHMQSDWGLGAVLGELSDTPGYDRPGLIKSGPGHTGYHAYDRAVTRATVDWLEQRGSAKPDRRPFMMVAGFVSPHCPFVAPPEDYEIYRDRISAADLPDPHLDQMHPVLQGQRAVTGFDDPQPLPIDAQMRVRRAYYGLCTFLDRQIASIIDALERSGLADDTLIVYTSDHGEQLGEHGLWWKSTMYEGSVGVPMIFHWPDRLRPGQVIRQNVSLMDVGPTLLELAGIGPLPDADGRSFACLFDGDEKLWPDEVIAEGVTVQPDPPVMRMVKRGPWKLVHYHDHRPQLFDVESDPEEFHDRAADPVYATVLQTMTARALADWDPARMQQRMAARRQEIPLIKAWYDRVRPPEADPTWHSGRSLINTYEPF
jgi:choline-sulfatase